MYSKSYHLDYLNEEVIKKLNDEFINQDIIIELDNTKYIDLEALKNLNPNILIRITGPYNEKRYNFHKNEARIKANVEYYKNSVVYTKEELIKILEKIYEIESNISPYWSDLQKVIYIYEKLSSLIAYSRKISKENVNEIVSLRGLIKSNSICGGYSLIFKEFMDRLGIENLYVEGFYHENEDDKMGQGHVWNIVRINGKNYPLDLTFNSNDVINGFVSSTEDFASNEFYKNYKPLYSEKELDYEKDLSSIDNKYVNQLYREIVNDKVIMHNSVRFVRNDGSEFILTEVNNKKVNGTNMYAYYFIQKVDNKLGLPLLLYSDLNVMKTLNYERYKEVIPDYKNIDISSIKDLIINKLFSLNNIKDSISKNSLYIGNISDKVLIKSKENMENFKTSTIKINTRNDGTTYIIEKDESKLPNINSYKYYDLDVIDNNFVVNMKNVHSENDLFKITNKKIVDILLNKKHVDDCSKYRSGYLGSVIRSGFSKYVDYNFNSQILLNNRNYVDYGEATLLGDKETKVKHSVK